MEVVDNLGRRRSTKPSDVTVEASGRRSSTPRRLIFRARPGGACAGDVTVRLAPGRYQVNELRLGSGARLVGSGPETVLAPRPGARYWALVVARGKNIRISDLALDGGGPPADEDGGIGIAVFDGSSDVRLQRLRMSRVRTDGVNVWGRYSSISVQDSQIESDGDGEAGVVALGSDESRDTSVIRSRVRGFTSFGVILQQQEHGRPAADLHGVVLDNVVSDIRDPSRDPCWTAAKYRTPGCGTNEGGIWTGGVEAAVIGNTVRRARWDGIETVGSSTHDDRPEQDLRHADRHLHRALDAPVDDRPQPDRRRACRDQRRVVARRRRLEAEHVRVQPHRPLEGRDRRRRRRRPNRIVGNVFVGGLRPSIVLQGSSHNVVRDNVGCGSRGDSLVEFSEARYDDGRRAVSRFNQLDRNQNKASAC